MKALVRINRIKTAWQFIDVSLEVADIATHGEVRRAMIRRIRGTKPKQPAKIKVKSERGPLR
jgi:hypothetical protein